LIFVRHASNILKRFRKHSNQNLKLLTNRYIGDRRILEKQEISRVVYGVCRKSLALSEIIRQYATRRFPLPDDADIPIRIGLYLLLFSQSYPDHAIVSETVESTPPPFRSLVNAILRRSCLEKIHLSAFITDHPDLSIRFSISPLFIEALSRISDDLSGDLAFLDREPVFHLHTDSRRIPHDQVEIRLNRIGVSFTPIPQLQSWAVTEIGGPLRDLLANGEFYLQNPASQLVSLIAARYTIRTAWDAAAAPGSKTLTTALLRPDITLIASDIRGDRLSLLQQNIRQFTPDAAILPVISDLNRPALINQTIDLFLLDLPCSSSGTVRKNPDLKFKLDTETIREKAAGQKRMLNALKPFPPGSHVLYSVCSIFPEEGEEVIENLLLSNSLEPTDLTPLLDSLEFRYQRSKNGIYLLPSPRLDNDLFYISLLKTTG